MTQDFPITGIVSAEIQSPDIDAHTTFLCEAWGLSRVDHPGTIRYFAGTGADPYSLALRQGLDSGLIAMTFRAASERAIDQIAKRAQSQGWSVFDGPAPEDRPGGGRMVDMVQPSGCRVRLVNGDTLKAATRSIDRPERLSHVNLNTKDVDGSTAMFERVLGFQLSDRSKPMAFLRTNRDHNVVVLADAPKEGLNHIAFHMPDIDGVMRGSGRMRDHGFEIGWGVGRHGPGNNVFSYFVDPLGYVLEYTTDMSIVDEIYRVGGPEDWVWPPGRTDQWGIAPPKSEACKAAQLAIGFA